MTCVCCFKIGNRGKVDHHGVSSRGSTHLLINQRKRNKVLQRRHIQRAIQHDAYTFELKNKTWRRTRSAQRILEKIRKVSKVNLRKLKGIKFLNDSFLFLPTSYYALISLKFF